MGRSAWSRREFLLGAAAVATAGSGSAACPPTEDNPQGPFYLPGAPLRAELAPAEEPGERLSIQGRVLGGPACLPLAGALVEVWHASADGFYYNLEGPADPSDFLLRASVRADERGRYGFRTVLPGHYRVSRTRWRARHIHYRVSHPGHRTLLTQLYFAGDPRLAEDPLARPSLVIRLAPDGAGGSGRGWTGTFDLVLEQG